MCRTSQLARLRQNHPEFGLILTVFRRHQWIGANTATIDVPPGGMVISHVLMSCRRIRGRRLLQRARNRVTGSDSYLSGITAATNQATMPTIKAPTRAAPKPSTLKPMSACFAIQEVTTSISAFTTSANSPMVSM